MASVNQNGNALQLVSEDLQRDREIVMVTVNQDGKAPKFASDDLKKDREIVMAAVNQYGGRLNLLPWSFGVTVPG